MLIYSIVQEIIYENYERQIFYRQLGLKFGQEIMAMRLIIKLPMPARLLHEWYMKPELTLYFKQTIKLIEYSRVNNLRIIFVISNLNTIKSNTNLN